MFLKNKVSELTIFDFDRSVETKFIKTKKKQVKSGCSNSSSSGT
jgi:hypothetical protein